ncbi:MAG: nicotinate-nucleotide adenylyltransferase [bacterium]|nr:nicotinate-nucleotide adenylyltransferase [bacterium]
MIKTGIMGGTFDPIHTGHMIIAQYAYESLGLDEVWFMTSGNPPHKADCKHTSAELRHKMVEMAVSSCDDFIPCDYEVKRSEYSYSAVTLRNFTEMYPEHEFYFIIGQDSLSYFDKWYHPEEIIRYAKIPVFPREADISLEEQIKSAKKKLDGDFIGIDMPLIGISSTEIRSRVKAGKSIRFMVPDAVEKYIMKKGLYR